RHGDDWLAQLLAYLEVNRDTVTRFAAAELPGVTLAPPEATYLAWLDCRATGLTQPCQCFLDPGRVACSAGSGFGPGGVGVVRLRVGWLRPMLLGARERVGCALQRAA